VQQGARSFLDSELQSIEEARARALAQRAAEQQQAAESPEPEAATEK